MTAMQGKPLAQHRPQKTGHEMRTLVFGARGQLGRDLVEVMGRDGPVTGRDLPELDIADETAVERAVADFAPELVINAAAYTDVEGAETRREEAFRVNATGAGVVAAAAARRDLPVVYYSTDFVFSGDKKTPYEPDDPPRPLGAYAESKRAGELATRDANPRCFILRTAWLYGPGKNNFVEKILRAAETRPELRVVEDEIGSPTYTLDLAEATRALCRRDAFGFYHAVNAGACSRYEFAKTIVQLAGLSVPVYPCKAEEMKSAARRPAYSVLSNDRLETATGHRMRAWRTALEAYMKRRIESK